MRTATKRSTILRPAAADARSTASQSGYGTGQITAQVQYDDLRTEVSSKTYAYMKHTRPRRALVIDQQKGLVAMYPLFIHAAA